MTAMPWVGKKEPEKEVETPGHMCYYTEKTVEGYHMDNALNLELLTRQNLPLVSAIHRKDISEDWVDTADTLMELTEYALEHRCMGHTYAVKYGDAYIGLILLGEAIPWETDPPEMAAEPFYRLMGFVLDSRYRSRGLGSQVLEEVIARIYQEYGPRPIALGVHRDNLGAARFYERHGFRKTDAMEGSDRYYLRYPAASLCEQRNCALEKPPANTGLCEERSDVATP